MWSNKRSLTLSKAFTTLMLAALICLLVAGPGIIGWLRSFTMNNLQDVHMGWFYATMYSGGAVAAVLLVLLYILLDNISKDILFDVKNQKLLRYISWCCFAGGAIGILSGIYYFPWALLGLAGLFMGLIVRIVKNLIARAIELKEENELTI